MGQSILPVDIDLLHNALHMYKHETVCVDNPVLVCFQCEDMFLGLGLLVITGDLKATAYSDILFTVCVCSFVTTV